MSTPKHNLDLTLTLIVKNEEKNLQNCLSSFEGVWKDLVIVDTGSTDNTKSVAEKFGARIFDFEWIRDFSAARNFGLDQIKSEWVMTLDADDIIQEEDKTHLISTLDDIIPKFNVTAMPYHYDGQRFSPAVLLHLPRIWKNSLNLRFIRPIHEYLKTSNIDNYLDIPVLHNKDHDPEQTSVKRNYEILKQHLENNPEDSLSNFYLGKESHKLGMFEDAINHFKKGISLAKTETDQINEAYTTIGKIYMQKGDAVKAKEAFENAIRVAPRFIEAYLLLAELEMNVFSIPKAIQLLTIAAQLKPPKTFVAYNSSMYAGKANQFLQLAYSKLRGKING